MLQPKFIPKPGQLDYTNIRYCPVMNVIPICDGKISGEIKTLKLLPGLLEVVGQFLVDSRGLRAVERGGKGSERRNLVWPPTTKSKSAPNQELHDWIDRTPG